MRSHSSLFAGMRALVSATLLIALTATFSYAQILGPLPKPKPQPIEIDRMADEMRTTEEVMLQLHAISVTTLHDRIDSAFDSLRRGQRVNIALTTGEESGRPMRLRLTVQVLIEYEVRPIGGIVRIASDLVPMFTGICAASRPIASSDFAGAVDYIEIDELTSMVHDRIQKLGEEYVVRSTHKQLYWNNPSAAGDVSSSKTHER
jgi:hypothetical protein